MHIKRQRETILIPRKREGERERERRQRRGGGRGRGRGERVRGEGKEVKLNELPPSPSQLTHPLLKHETHRSKEIDEL